MPHPNVLLSAAVLLRIVAQEKSMSVLDWAMAFLAPAVHRRRPVAAGADGLPAAGGEMSATMRGTRPQ